MSKMSECFVRRTKTAWRLANEYGSYLWKVLSIFNLLYAAVWPYTDHEQKDPKSLQDRLE